MALRFEETSNRFGRKLVASGKSDLTYEIVNKWDLPRGVGYAVFIRDNAGKSVTGNTAAFHSKATSPDTAIEWCNIRNGETK